MSYFINKQSSDLPPYEQMNPKIRDIHDEVACIGQMLDPELCGNDKELSTEIGLAYTVASWVGHNPSLLLSWLRNALIDCDVDIEKHPINGLLDICQGYFEYEEVKAHLEENDEQPTEGTMHNEKGGSE